MKYIDEYRSKPIVAHLIRQIQKQSHSQTMTFMEVCGTHTMAIARFGLRQLLPSPIRLISGPGCPVCVTSNSYLDHAIALARMDKAIICTFGDMMRVPGSTSSLEREKAHGCDIRIVASTLDAIDLAQNFPEREVIFLGVGFETTAPTIAAAISMATQSDLRNFSVLSANKIVPPALQALLSGPVKLDGFLLPGHVSTIIGAKAYRPLLDASRIPGVIAGFEPVDILQALHELVRQVATKSPSLHTSYVRVVTEEGNMRAQAMLQETFETCDASWRGIGIIPQSGLRIRDGFSQFDAARKFSVTVEPTQEAKGCRCGEILTGQLLPKDCKLFETHCTPQNPVGACMVSSEGTCAAYYTYER
jgi:hydrogenase expression/formation protein HypD